MPTAPTPLALRRVRTNGIETTVATAGAGPAILLLHGFPHTWQVWNTVIGPLAHHFRVLAPDLRGLGAATRAADGYDSANLALDAAGVLDALGEPNADVIAIDAGVPAAFLLALHHPERVRRLVLMEATLGTLPGAEAFHAGGPPWWFGFHAVPDLAETVLIGHEAEYIDWFLTAGTRGHGVPPNERSAFLDAYSGRESLRGAFSHYRAMPTTAHQIDAAVSTHRLTTPTTAIGAHPVGESLACQLRPITNNLTEHVIPDCGHIIPLDRPDALLEALADALGVPLRLSTP
ncbi:alpha/beta hydrolase [Nocardia callitridis]|uniref:Alpha/beta hydrolase n=1 Tax=Nocardia callitridis TaxID=648753 RepID=A0ABP9KM77_9NOCA